MTSLAPVFKRVKPALGTLLELTVRGATGDRAITATEAAFAETRRLEALLSRFDSTSEISRLNSPAAKDQWVRLSPPVRDVLELGATIERDSGGSFRLMPECPHATGECFVLEGDFARRSGDCTFDLGGIAKGFIVDQVFDLLTARLEGCAVVVNAGGDLRCSDSESIELRIPTRGDECRFAITLRGAAVATSSILGDRLAVGTASARFSSPPQGASRSVSVVATRCAVADAFTKVALFGSDPANSGVLGVHRFDADGAPLAG